VNVSEKSAAAIYWIKPEDGGTITLQKVMILIFSTMRTLDFVLTVYKSMYDS
jgi:hypothetical protein